MATDTSHVHVNRKEYWTIFVVLFVLTVMEVGVVYVPGIPRGALIAALSLMALVKAGFVGLFFMHLGHETTWVKWSVIVPLMIPFFYAAVLVAEAVWRLLG